jgi:TolB-like protein/lipopolysaccharide biosynthesis regulator YciM
MHGDKVNIAARIQPLAEPEGICLSHQVYDQIRSQVEVGMVKLGRGELKNIQEPVNIYKMVMPWEKSRLPWSERLKFKLRQKRGQQIVLMMKTLLISAILVFAGLYIWQWMEGKKEDVVVKSKKETSRAISASSSQEETLSLDKHRIAVLPFANMSGDAENEYFSDGMTEEMISQLSKISGLEVIARTSVMTYKGKDKKVEEIGRELRVGTVLESSVRKAVDKLRITVQLINTQNQAHLWTQTYDRELKDVFAIQSDVAQKVAEALKVQLMAGEKQRIEKKGTENREAYNLYLKGLYYWNKATKEGLEKAIEYFQQAIDKDLNYVLAYAGLANSYTFLGHRYLPPKEIFPKAKAAAMKALEMDDTIAEAHIALARIRALYDWDWSGAEREFKRALELNPSYAYAHSSYGINYLSPMGRHEEAIAELKHAQELDPLSLPINEAVAWGFLWARQYDQVIEQSRKVLEMDPNYIWIHLTIGIAYRREGMYEQSIAEFQKMKDLMKASPPWAEMNFACTYAVSGKKEETYKIIDELKERAKQEYIPSWYFAVIYVGLDEKDQAFEWLQKAYDERSSNVMMWLKVDAWYDNLRSDPRFTELTQKVGFE